MSLNQCRWVCGRNVKISGSFKSKARFISGGHLGCLTELCETVELRIKFEGQHPSVLLSDVILVGLQEILLTFYHNSTPVRPSVRNQFMSRTKLNTKCSSGSEVERFSIRGSARCSGRTTQNAPDLN